MAGLEMQKCMQDAQSELLQAAAERCGNEASQRILQSLDKVITHRANTVTPLSACMAS